MAELSIYATLNKEKNCICIEVSARLFDKRMSLVTRDTLVKIGNHVVHMTCVQSFLMYALMCKTCSLSVCADVLKSVHTKLILTTLQIPYAIV